MIDECRLSLQRSLFWDNIWLMEIYKYNDELNSRFDIEGRESYMDAPNYDCVEFVCPKHNTPMPNIELAWGKHIGFKLVCPMCERELKYAPIRFDDQKFSDLQRKAHAMYIARGLKRAKLIRLDDVYVSEIKRFDALGKESKESNYSIKADIKEDIDGHSIVIIYVGYKGKKDKSQFFIKPEKLQLSTDYKDMDPAKILAKIEVTLKDRIIKQKYDE